MKHQKNLMMKMMLSGKVKEALDKVVDGLVDAFNLDQEQFRALLIGAAEKIADQVDVIVLAQGSMAYVEQDIEKAVGKPTLSSPRFGAIELKKALQAKGLMV